MIRLRAVAHRNFTFNIHSSNTSGRCRPYARKAGTWNTKGSPDAWPNVNRVNALAPGWVNDGTGKKALVTDEAARND